MKQNIEQLVIHLDNTELDKIHIQKAKLEVQGSYKLLLNSKLESEVYDVPKIEEIMDDNYISKNWATFIELLVELGEKGHREGYIKGYRQALLDVFNKIEKGKNT